MLIECHGSPFLLGHCLYCAIKVVTVIFELCYMYKKKITVSCFKFELPLQRPRYIYLIVYIMFNIFFRTFSKLVLFLKTMVITWINLQLCWYLIGFYPKLHVCSNGTLKLLLNWAFSLFSLLEWLGVVCVDVYAE